MNAPVSASIRINFVVAGGGHVCGVVVAGPHENAKEPDRWTAHTRFERHVVKVVDSHGACPLERAEVGEREFNRARGTGATGSDQGHGDRPPEGGNVSRRR
jgi:hypothetical protein